jgi:hypothetical protein
MTAGVCAARKMLDFCDVWGFLDHSGSRSKEESAFQEDVGARYKSFAAVARLGVFIVVGAGV